MNPKSEVTLAMFMKIAHKEGLGRVTVTGSISSAVAHLFRYKDMKISTSVLVKQM